MDSHIEEMQVTIRVLRVGKKQFSKSLFLQLPVKHPTTKDIKNIWGYVKIEPNSPYDIDCIWIKDGVLYRSNLEDTSDLAFIEIVENKGQIFIDV